MESLWSHSLGFQIYSLILWLSLLPFQHLKNLPSEKKMLKRKNYHFNVLFLHKVYWQDAFQCIKNRKLNAIAKKNKWLMLWNYLKNNIGVKWKKKHNTFLHLITRSGLELVTDKTPHRIRGTDVGLLLKGTCLYRSTGIGVKVSCCMCLLKDIEEFSFHVPVQLLLCSPLSKIYLRKT